MGRRGGARRHPDGAGATRRIQRVWQCLFRPLTVLTVLSLPVSGYSDVSGASPGACAPRSASMHRSQVT